jgi:hypothetical protein
MYFGQPGVVALLGAKSSTWPRSPAGIAGPSLHCTTDLVTAKNRGTPPSWNPPTRQALKRAWSHTAEAAQRCLTGRLPFLRRTHD